MRAQEGDKYIAGDKISGAETDGTHRTTKSLGLRPNNISLRLSRGMGERDDDVVWRRRRADLRIYWTVGRLGAAAAAAATWTVFLRGIRCLFTARTDARLAYRFASIILRPVLGYIYCYR